MKIKSLLLIGLLSACGGETTENTPAASMPMQAAHASAPTESQAVMKLDYAAYQKSANALLKAQQTGFTIPEHVHPTPNSSGGKNMQHDLADGLTLAIDTDAADNIQTVRIVWQPEKSPNQSKQLSSAAAALLSATLPDDKSMTRDVIAQMDSAMQSHQAREFARFGVAFKIASTDLPSMVLTAQPE